MTTCLGKSCSFGLPRVPFVNCCQFLYLVISLLVLRAGCGIRLYQFLIIAYLFTLKHSRILKCTAFRTRGNRTFFCFPYHKCENHTVPFFEKREESCHQNRDLPLGSFGLNIFTFCCKHINKYTGSNRSARMMSIFQGT